MMNGKKATEKVLSDLSKLATCVWNQAEKFPQIAQKIAHSDQQSANQFRGGGK